MPHERSLWNVLLGTFPGTKPSMGHSTVDKMGSPCSVSYGIPHGMFHVLSHVQTPSLSMACPVACTIGHPMVDSVGSTRPLDIPWRSPWDTPFLLKYYGLCRDLPCGTAWDVPRGGKFGMVYTRHQGTSHEITCGGVEIHGTSHGKPHGIPYPVVHIIIRSVVFLTRYTPWAKMPRMGFHVARPILVV